MRNRFSGWLVGAAVGVLFGGILAMDAVADARAATLEVDVELAGTPAEGLVQVRDGEGRVVAEGHAGEGLRLPAGTYGVRVACPPARAERTLQDVRLAPGSTIRRVVRFARAPDPGST